MWKRWFFLSYWKYLLKKPDKYDRRYYATRWQRFWCRAGNHKCGVVYYNIAGNEPDMHCRNCGDDLG